MPLYLLIKFLSPYHFPITEGSGGTELAGGLPSLDPLPAPKKPKAALHHMHSQAPLYTQLFFFLERVPSTNDLSIPILLPFPAALVTGSSTKEPSWFHCNCSRTRRVSQQLVCAALATGALPELAPTEIYCTHACTVTTPATRIAAGIPLELRTNMHLNKSNVVRARLFHRDFYLQPKGLSIQSSAVPYSSLTLNTLKTHSYLSGNSSVFNEAIFVLQQIHWQPWATGNLINNIFQSP